MSLSHLGRRPGVYTKYPAAEKKKVHEQIFWFIGKGLPFHDACWAVQVDPQEIEDAMATDPHVRCGFKHQIALAQLALIKTMQMGGRGMSPAKVALEQLQAQHKSWAKASAATLAKQFEDALEALKKIFEPKEYEKIVRVLERFS